MELKMIRQIVVVWNWRDSGTTYYGSVMPEEIAMVD
eukprot:COSAG02_NODE_202_length_29305_cov_20.432377_16_plen_36_part_00